MTKTKRQDSPVEKMEKLVRLMKQYLKRTKPFGKIEVDKIEVHGGGGGGWVVLYHHSYNSSLTPKMKSVEYRVAGFRLRQDGSLESPFDMILR